MKKTILFGLTLLAVSPLFANDAMFGPEGKAIYTCKRFLKPAPYFTIAEQGEHYVVKFYSYLRNKHTAGQPHNADPEFFFKNFRLKDSGDLFSIEFTMKKESCKFVPNESLFACEEGFSWIGVDPAKAPLRAKVAQIDGKDENGHLVTTTQTAYLNYVNLKMSKLSGERTLDFKTGEVQERKPFISDRLHVDFTGVGEPGVSYATYISTIDYTDHDCRYKE